jgi:hypothetical protein
MMGSRIDGSRDRTDVYVAEPGGCECLECGCIFIGAEWHTLCLICATEVGTNPGSEQKGENPEHD